jgi:hypothetical protein
MLIPTMKIWKNGRNKIYTTERSGIPTDNYWIQMQFQMEVCDLDECDFFETRMKISEEEFYADTTRSIKA